MGFIITMLAIVGCLAVVKFLYRGYYGVRKLKYMNELIDRFEQDSTPEASIAHLRYGKPSSMYTIPDDIYVWCMSHSPERSICERHRATQQDFREIFMTLCVTCPAMIRGFFVPVSAFFFYPTLDHILKNKDNLDSQRIVNDLYVFFERQ